MSRTDQLISDYLDGRLDEAAQKELADLLAQNQELRNEFLELYRQHRLLAGQQEAVVMSASVERVMEELRREKVEKKADYASAVARGSFWHRLLSLEFLTWPRVGWAGAAAAFVLLALFGGRLFFGNASISAVVKQASPGVTLVRAGRSQICPEGTQLRTGDMLETTADATAVVQYQTEPTMLQLRPNTQLRFQKTSHGKRLNLESGEIAVVAGHQPTNAPMIFVTPHAEARVVGTRFQLADRRFSTWLQVSEGGVAFQRISSKGGLQGEVGGEAGANEVLVKTGQYAVVCDGIPLKTLEVTNGLDLEHPLPIDIGWFSYYAKPSWYVHPPMIQEVNADTSSRTFELPATRGSLLVSGMAVINSTINPLPAGNGDVGYALGLSVKSDAPGVDGYLACIRRHEGKTTLEIVNENFETIATLPVSIPPGPACKLKLTLERTAGKAAWVRAKAWISSEPQEWQLEKPVELRDSSEVFELRLMTENSACTFENTSAFLIE